MHEDLPDEGRTTTSTEVTDGVSDADPDALLVPDPPPPPGVPAVPDLELVRPEAEEAVLPDQDATPDAAMPEPPD